MSDNDKLITLAIHTYEQAQILCSILESEGISAYMQNVDPEQPAIFAGVRVKIRERDLPKALRLVEDLELEGAPRGKETVLPKNKIILVPVDFSACSHKAAEWAIRFAKDAEASVLLMHSYYSPSYMAYTPYTDGTTFSAMAPRSAVMEGYKDAEGKLEALVAELNDRMDPSTAAGAKAPLPKVSLHSRLLQGIPEDLIMECCRELQPYLLVMGSRGTANREYELVGSVTADVIDRCRIPILVIPAEVPDRAFSDLSRVAFATSFEPKDLVYFDVFMEMVERYKMNIFIFNISARDERAELTVKTKEVRDYCKKYYPEASIDYRVLKEGDRLEAIASFLEEQDIELVALPVKRKGMLSRLVAPGLPHRMLLSTRVPLLVFNSK